MRGQTCKGGHVEGMARVESLIDVAEGHVEAVVGVVASVWSRKVSTVSLAMSVLGSAAIPKEGVVRRRSMINSVFRLSFDSP